MTKQLSMAEHSFPEIGKTWAAQCETRASARALHEDLVKVTDLRWPLGTCHTDPVYQHAPNTPPGLQPRLADRNLRLSPEVPCLILPPSPAPSRVRVHAHHGPIHHHRQWPEAPLFPGSHPAQAPRSEPHFPSLRFSPTWAWFGISSEVLDCYPAAPHRS